MDLVEYNKHITYNIPAYRLAKQMELLSEEDIVHPEIEETLFDNTYTRTLSAKANEVHVGMLHKQSTLNVILEGEAIIYLMGKQIYVKAGDTFVSPPMCKKVMRTLQDTKIMNVCNVPRDIDIQDAKELLVYTEEEELIKYKEAICLLEQ